MSPLPSLVRTWRCAAVAATTKLTALRSPGFTVTCCGSAVAVERDPERLARLHDQVSLRRLTNQVGLDDSLAIGRDLGAARERRKSSLADAYVVRSDRDTNEHGDRRRTERLSVHVDLSAHLVDAYGQ